MSSRLDRFLSTHMQLSRAALRPVLAAGRVSVNGWVEKDRQRRIERFDRVELDGQVLQDCPRRYWMLNKPAGVVSATLDARHRTVLDLLPEAEQAGLHIPGRLDFHSTGLLLLTNDSQWSRRLSLPESAVHKRYRVTLEKPLNHDYVDAFAAGMYFAYEDITTRPARLEILSEHEADVWLCEGRYHQIKRMFGRFRNRVLTLHRSAIGGLALDPGLAPGQSRVLTVDEAGRVFSKQP